MLNLIHPDTALTAVCCLPYLAKSEIMFPFLETRIRLPPKMSADHAELLALMERCRILVTDLKATGVISRDAGAISLLQVRRMPINVR